MTTRNENYMTMVAATIKVLDNNEAVWVTNNPFNALVKSIKEDSRLVQDAQKGGSNISTGATQDKETAGDLAIALAVKLSKLTQVYALEKNNMTLHNQIRLTRSGLDFYGDAELVPVLEDFRQRLASLDPEVTEYGVTAAEIARLETLTSAFDAIKSNPRIIITERKSHNTNIPALIRHIRLSLSKIDKLINIWADSFPQFLSNYTNARIIIDLGGRHEKPVPPVA